MVSVIVVVSELLLPMLGVAAGPSTDCLFLPEWCRLAFLARMKSIKFS